ncbi:MULTISPECIES: TonB-dependent receptor [unclassified Spirosoma]|uniref:SusC/RagA family TonB-linked outer membrane protein n=1 Tax=unclassified Spirosoma TaxID=2621999 RepID=UPI00095D70A0|nr:MULTISPECIES: TonB-dependent receptor [unclassified Spirosoma]MBN8824887.1 TonB-dependent receptor [Spirosoma sp.]OJW74788.1 MAG: SusC/RagA family TonB-linked outer membrane protein [Spirosoma sp. 48-14]
MDLFTAFASREKSRWIIGFMLLLSLHCQAQSGRSVTLKGVVTSADTRQGIPGANIIVKNTQIGATTNAEGAFVLSVPEGTRVVTVSYIGYQTKDVSIVGQNNVNIVLETDDRSLNEVVVVGYGTVKKSDLTGAVSSVKAAELKQTPIANFVQGLQARASGVQVTQNSGAPGGTISVRIRGNSSISGSSEPLYVVDGFPISGNDNPLAGGGSSFGTDNGNRLSVLSTLNPNDIESIEVLKDASATAIYGTRGANGVVLITTKRGKTGQTRVTYEGYYGQQQIRRMLPLMNATQFAQYENEISGQTLYPNPEQLGAGTDWQSYIFQKGGMQNHQLSVSGGTDKSLFNVSLNYFDQDGIIINSNFKRGSVRVNLDNTISKNFKIGTSLTYTYSQNNGAVTSTLADAGAGGIVISALAAPPTVSPYDAQGNPTIFSGRYIDINNPISVATNVLNRNTTRRFLGNIFADWTIIDGLTYRASFGGDLVNDTRDSYVNRLVRTGAQVNGIGGKGNTYSNTFLHESLLNYQKSFGVHNLALTGVFSTQSQLQTSDASTGQTFPNDLVLNDNLSQASIVTISSNKQSWRLDSYTGRINYNYKSKYLLTLTGRVDGSSRFGANNKYGFFPSVAGAWRVSEEKFMQGQQVVSDLKLRASFGITGNADIPLYNSLSRLNSVGNYNFNNTRNIGILAANIANPDLRWEKSAQTDLGVDIGLLNNRVQLTADVYIKKTSDLLLSRAIPLSSGFGSVFGNFGGLENRGIELSLNVGVLNGPLKWDISGNISANRNKLTLIDGKRTEIIPGDGGGSVAAFSNTSLLRIGAPIGSFYGYYFDGIYQTGDNIPTGKTAGNIRYRDLNGDGVISAADQDIIGNPNPNYYFGLTNNLKFKGFDFSLFIQGVQGNQLFNVARLRLESASGGSNQYVTVVDRWTPSNPSNRYQKASIGQRVSQSDFQIEDGSFVRFKNATLGYTFPQIGKINWLRNSRVYVSANNFVTITKYTGYDPEVNTAGQNNLNLGVDNIGYPVAKSFIAGLQLTF